MSIYALKPKFQALLRPFVRRLHALGVTANQVTLAACALSIALGAWLYFAAPDPQAFLLIPLWMFLRMAFNAIDGMLAREFGQQSKLGAYLNELTDVIADAALVLPFAAVAPFATAHGPVWLAIFVVLAGLSEFAGAIGPTVGASRRYDGPMGKSDRAFVLGAIALWIGIAGALPAWAYWLFPALCALTAWTVVRRVRNGLREAR
jgi:CDP-diacylglycerol---glycerol-3-phosphate 3-phosphatidyltransferase